MNMNKNYCSLKGWKWTLLSSNIPTGGGLELLWILIIRVKEAIVKITGEGSFGVLRTESGVHVETGTYDHF